MKNYRKAYVALLMVNKEVTDALWAIYKSDILSRQDMLKVYSLDSNIYALSTSLYHKKWKKWRLEGYIKRK